MSESGFPSEAWLRDLFASNEQALGLDADFRVMRSEVPYAYGTLTPVILGAKAEREAGSLRRPGADPAHFDYFGTYLTWSEYLPWPIDIHEFADRWRRADLICAIAAIGRLAENAAEKGAMLRDHADGLAPEYRERFEAACRVPTGGLGRQLVAPQPVLMALRWLLGTAPLREPVDAPAPTLSDAVLFVHAVGSALGEGGSAIPPDEEPRPEMLMLTLMNLALYSDRPDIYSSIDRSVRLWRQYGELAEQYLGRSASALFLSATGLEPEDVLAVGFALYAHASGYSRGDAVVLNSGIHPDVPPELVERFTAVAASDLEAFSALGPPTSEFDTLALERTPVALLDHGLLVLDSALLWRRCTVGLFWMVHDHLDSKGREQWRKAYAAMIEAFVEDSLTPIAPYVVGGGSTTFYTEEDLCRAYGETARCDALIDLGADWLVVEVVNTQISAPARIDADLDKLTDDLDRKILSKCRQLDATVANLIENEEPLTGIPNGSRSPSFHPVLVVGGGLPINPVLSSFVRSRLDEHGYLKQRGVGRLSLLDLEDVESLEGLAENGYSPQAILSGWQDSDLRDMPLNNYLLRRRLNSEVRRPARMAGVVDDAFEDVVRRLQMTRPADAQGA